MSVEALQAREIVRQPGAAAPAPAMLTPRPRGGLFRKYVLFFVGVVLAAVAAGGGFQIWFAYQEQTESLARIQKEQAEAAAAKISQFIKEIEDQIGWTTQLPWSASTLQQRRFDALRLLRQVPAVTELSEIDAQGHEQLRVSRLAMDVAGSNIDYSKDPKFTEAMAKKVYYGPVYFRRESEPYMTLALTGSRREDGVSVAEVNLKFIWDVITQIKVGAKGQAYVVDTQGRLIADPDISLVLRNTKVEPKFRGNGGTDDHFGRDFQGHEVITASAPIPPMGWTAIVDLPIGEARMPLYASLARAAVIMMTGVFVAFLTGLFLARRMIVPIRNLQQGAAEIGAGDFGLRIDIRTGDELEGLATQFNQMAAQLQESHRDLERKIEERTDQLAQSVRELTALGAIAAAVNSILDLDKVLTTIVTKAVELSDTETGSIYVFDDSAQEFRLRATYGASVRFIAQLDDLHIGLGETPVGEAAAGGGPVQIPDLSRMPPGKVRDVLESDGCRALLVVPLLRADEVIGALVVRRRTAGEFPPDTIRLMESFAGQSVLAVHNARLFTELQDKSRQLELASEHKSQFLANMSHELRTPLNAIIGYAELISDQTYGAIPDRARTALERVQVNGKHLLGLINDVLDLAKIEAGELTLSLTEYDPLEIVRSVLESTASLAQNKGLDLRSDVPSDHLSKGRGDERRLTQVLLNIVANAIKFTDRGYVEVGLREVGETFAFAVRDTGPGISRENQARIFDEFKQVNDSSTRAKGGTGLGLSIAKKITELHGGSIGVTSAPGEGSTFVANVPRRVDIGKDGP